MRVLVTGGAGYIGSHAARELQDAGHDVVVLDDLSAGHRGAVPVGIPLVVGDLGDPGSLRKALGGVEAVLHFAGLLSVGQSVADPIPYYRTNVAKGVALLGAMAEAGVGKLVFSSTCAVYGMPVRVPLDEDHPQNPISPYGATKRAFERALSDLATAGRVRAVSLRYFNASGCHPDGSLGEDHRPEEHLIPLALDAGLGRRPPLTIYGTDYDTPDGTCIRDYIHVQDLARAHVLSLRALEGGEPFQAFNLGSESGYSVREVLQSVERVMGKPVPARVGPRRLGDPPRLVSSAARIRALGFRPAHVELDGIVETALRWRVDHPQGYGAAA
ncbi:MAG TPA: UDP-glucose 4-epimerase GalE [Vicinamibacteria bacterium]|nr:UDP-glucose 4-epimerase GalE [Vicinamibacteria bacterium]